MVSLDQNTEYQPNAELLFQSQNTPLLRNEENDPFKLAPQQATEELSIIDHIQQKQEEIEKRLSCRFKLYTFSLIFFTMVNTFFVVFHRYDTKGSEWTLRYKLGLIFYFINFMSILVLKINFILSALILIATFIYSFVLYARLAIFLKPRKSRRVLNANGEEVSSDDEYVD